MHYKELHSQRLSLTTINMAGLLDMHEYSKKNLFYRYFEYNSFDSIEQTKEYLQSLIDRSKLGKDHFWFIRLKRNKKVIGTFGLVGIDTKRNCTEIGFGISPDYWGVGYFTETLNLVVDYLFNDLKFYRISAKTQSKNLPSIKGLQKSGFSVEGKMRDYYRSIDGQRHDATLLSLLIHEYK